jgi:hypothetical protein
VLTGQEHGSDAATRDGRIDHAWHGFICEIVVMHSMEVSMVQ